MEDTHDGLGCYMGILFLIVVVSLFLGYAKRQYDYEQSLPGNCTVDNFRHRIHQLDIIAALPIPSTRSGPSEYVVDRNLQSVIRLRGCSVRINDALENAEYSLRNLDFVQYAEWRDTLQKELEKMERK